MITIQDVREAASPHCIEVRGIVYRDDGQALVLLVMDEGANSAFYFSSGFLRDERQALEFTYNLLTSHTTEEIMNLLKNDKLFPNIRGVMLKDRPVTLYLSGKVKITELQGGDARVEIFFSDHNKTAVINRNQALNIIEVHGPETDDWKGKPVVLYAEEGVWFGKHQWGVRVDAQKTAAALKAESRKASKVTSQPEQEPDTVDDIPFDLDFDIPEQAELLTAGNPGAYSD